MKTPNVIDLVRHHWLISAVAGAVLLVLVLFAFASVSDWWASRSTNKQDQRLEKNINASETKAGASEANANEHRDSRQAAEGRADQAWQDKQRAAENSNRSAARVNEARQNYEKTRRTNPADAPDLSDADLCAELAKRGIACN